MNKKSLLCTSIAAIALSAASQGAMASVYITEWMYSGLAEYVEFTNVSSTSVDFTGWSYDDDSRLVGIFDLSAFGTVAAGESVIITELDAAAFRTEWNLDSSVKVLGGYTNNLGRNDEINLFDDTGALVDRLAYGDQTFVGTIRTTDVSGRTDGVSALGANDPYQWVLSTDGDVDGAYYSVSGELGSPGLYTSAVPVPGAAWLMFSGLVGLVGAARRRAAK